ncbi:MAG: hypothetical protein CMI26_08050 [Opitutae bacterium]|nr:hypothetical protein [Opitutae bacterium]
MENYLTGRSDSGHPALEDEGIGSFRSYLDQESVSPEDSTDDQLSVESAAIPRESALLYEEDGGPKVEVVSIDGRPVQIVVHLESGRILELNCEY